MAKELKIKLASGNAPDLFGKMSSERAQVRKDESISRLIKAGFLLTKDQSALLNQVVEKGKEIEDLLTKKESLSDEDNERMATEFVDYIEKKGKLSSWSSTSEEERRRLVNRFIRRREPVFLKKKHGERHKNANSLSVELADLVSDFEQSKKIKSPLRILKTKPFFACPGCGTFIGTEPSASALNCDCGRGVIQKPSDAIKNTVYIPSENLPTFVSKNLWLEYGVEHLFRRLDYSTVCGAHILGHSGVYHEIDVVAQSPKKHIRVLIECKNTVVKIGDILKLYGKMQDTGFSVGMIFSTSPSTSIESDAYKLAESKHIHVIAGILELNDEEMKAAVFKIESEEVENSPKTRS